MSTFTRGLWDFRGCSWTGEIGRNTWVRISLQANGWHWFKWRTLKSHAQRLAEDKGCQRKRAKNQGHEA